MGSSEIGCVVCALQQPTHVLHVCSSRVCAPWHALRIFVISASDGGLYPIALLVEELKSDDPEAHIAAMRRLSLIAKAVGPERCRSELIPFLKGMLYDADGLMVAVVVRARRTP